VLTTASQIALTWNAGASSGGLAIIDYRIFYDQSVGIWVELAQNITTTSYITTVTLIQSRTYSFMV